MIKGTQRDTVTIVTTAYMNSYPPYGNTPGCNEDFMPLFCVCTAPLLSEESHHKYLSYTHIGTCIFADIYGYRKTVFLCD